MRAGIWVHWDRNFFSKLKLNAIRALGCAVPRKKVGMIPDPYERIRHARSGLLVMRLLSVISLLFVVRAAYAQSGLDSHWIAFDRAGAPNSDLQCFTPNNVTVSHGNLVLTTKSEKTTCSSYDLRAGTHEYTSGFIAMRSFRFLYGTVEFRAKFGGGPGAGAWPTVWMQGASCQASDPTGTDDNCNDQEIDIAEILQSDFTHVNQQIHVNHFANNDGCKPSSTDTSQNFHVYQLVWGPGSLVFKIDGATTCTIKRLRS